MRFHLTLVDPEIVRICSEDPYNSPSHLSSNVRLVGGGTYLTERMIGRGVYLGEPAELTQD